MAQPRARRGRKIVDSDDEREAGTANNDGSRITEQSKASTPRKSKGVQSLKKISDDQSKSKTLHSFFNRVTQEQQAKSCSTPSSLPDIAIEPAEDIYDDMPGPDYAKINQKSRSNTPSFLSRKRSSDSLGTTSAANDKNAAQGVRKFLKRQDGTKAPLPGSEAPKTPNVDPRPWTEKFHPLSLEELVVHKKKVADVRHWLQGSLAGDKHKKLLVLKGAAGTGKTMTVSILSKVLGYQVVEWKNPTASDGNSAEYVSVSSQLEDFLGRGRKFAALELVSSNGETKRSTVGYQAEAGRNGHAQVLLMEEFPNNLTGHSTASQAFRSSILQFLSAAVYPSAPQCPLVLIISESVLSNSSSSSDNFTAHRLLGQEILYHPGTAIIEFNPVASTFISKALNIILQKRSREIGKYYSPHLDVLKKLSEFGDVRNATSTLEFLCLQEGTLLDTGQNTAKASRRPIKKIQGVQDANLEQDFALIGLRESSIGLFHAVGKVVYSKRMPRDTKSAQSDGESQLANHLKHHSRPQESEVEPETLIDETGTDTSTFIAALHENYLPSCHASDKNLESTLNIANNCLGALCDADLLGNATEGKMRQYSGAHDARLNSELAFQTSVRGLLFHLQHPVKREALLPTRSKAEAYRMFYPASMKLWRRREEIHDSIEMLTRQALDGSLLSGVRLGANTRVDKLHQALQDTAENNMGSSPSRVDDQNRSGERIIIGSGQSPFQEMLLERLPVLARLVMVPTTTMTHRNHSRPSSTSSAVNVIKQINEATRFEVGASSSNMRALHDNSASDDEYDDSSRATFDNFLKAQDVAKRGINFAGGEALSAGPSRQTKRDEEDEKEDEELEMQKLVLSDDDIEDD